MVNRQKKERRRREEVRLVALGEIFFNETLIPQRNAATALPSYLSTV